MRTISHLDHIPSDRSVSFQCQNISIGTELMLFAHCDQILFMHRDKDSSLSKSLPLKSDSIVTQARVCQLQKMTLIIATTEKDVQVFGSMGEASIYSYTPSWNTETELSFCRGIAAFEAFNCVFVLIGTSMGTTLMFKAAVESKTLSDFEMVREMDGHTFPVRCIESASNGHHIASADDGGHIVIRKAQQDFDITHKLIPQNYPISALRFCLDTWLICASITGYIHIYHAEDFVLYVKIAAHSRAITALDSSGDYFATVGEDTFLNIWGLAGSETSPDIELIASHRIENEILVGVAFDGGPHTFLTAAYDRKYVSRWALE